jgi:DNA-binding response OmpR family regulator
LSHILLIDDDPDFSAALATKLRCAGHRVTWAASCADGLDVLSALSEGDRALDAVLVDMFMPDADGFETIHALRDVGISAPVIAISGSSSKRPDGILSWARSLGADGSLEKPFEIDRLISLVDTIHGAPGSP